MNNEPNNNVVNNDNQKMQEVNVMPEKGSGPTVIDTTKKSSSNIGIFIFIGILIALIFCIDPITSFINQYIKKPDTVVKRTDNTDNLTNGFLLINDNTNNILIDNIKYYHFKKLNDSKTIELNYVSSSKYSNAADLNTIIELYDADKKILYKTSFFPKEVIEKDTVRVYSFTVDIDVYNNAYYALVKKQGGTTQNTSSVLTCKYTDTNTNVMANYKTVYNFVNEFLTSYSVDKNVTVINTGVSDIVIQNDRYVKEVKQENDELLKYISTNYSNNHLQYSIDLNGNLNGYIPKYSKEYTITRIKKLEEAKKWTCE